MNRIRTRTAAFGLWKLLTKIGALSSLGIVPLFADAPANPATLSGWAEIPSDFRQPGPVSGQFTGGGNGVSTPFTGQPIPGFSGIIPASSPGEFFALPDNGYGSQGNSADFIIGLYLITPDFKNTGDGTTGNGPVAVNSFIPFSDPNGLLSSSFISGGPVYTREKYYPSSSKQIDVDPDIKNGKLLTGADFDVESVTRLDDGTFWVGEEFGPYLLHFNAQGELMEAPIPHPFLRAPQNVANTQQNPANLPSSRGFEAIARNADGSKIYVSTESSINSEPDKRMIEIFEFDPIARQYTGLSYKYKKDSSDPITGNTNNTSNTFVLGDMTNIAGSVYLLIERDDGQGPVGFGNPNPPAIQKKLYLIDLHEVGPDGILLKREVVDLLDIPDPLDIGGPLPYGTPADRFTYPLQSVESLTVVDDHTVLVGLDNNYPGGNGRIPGTPDGTEIITIRFQDPLASLEVVGRTAIEKWRKANFGSPLGDGDTADLADFDSDGLVNLLEYAFGTNPTPDSGMGLPGLAPLSYRDNTIQNGQPLISPAGEAFEFRFIRRSDYATAGITYIPEFNSRLEADWSPSPATPQVLADDGTHQVVSVPFPTPEDGQTKDFARVRILGDTE
ncbi:esterase-like activity of phytase family protein [Luteolibacter algae]|uniref:Esterase-like activity of phytase family protein n=1 Tax=Luteolibacter algae TaxID=454151 RepID=A0ABW5DB24_9BACT